MCETKQNLKVMSFNLRIATVNDGVNYFFNRAGRVLEAISAEAPDLIGFQEANDEMREFLRKSLPGYTVLGSGRKAGYSGEGTPLAFRSDRFELISFDTKWLSDTPEVPESRFAESDQSKYPRIYVHARLRCIRSGRIVNFINTHTDHTGVQARYLETRQLMELVRSFKDSGVVITGDFNATPETPEIRLLVSDPALGISDAAEGAGPTFHNFGRRTGENMLKIDYVFTDLPCAEAHVVEDTPVEGVYISDHCPVVADLSL